MWSILQLKPFSRHLNKTLETLYSPRLMTQMTSLLEFDMLMLMHLILWVRLVRSSRRTVSLPTISGGSILSSTPSAPLLCQSATTIAEPNRAEREVSNIDRAAREAQELADDKIMVEKELSRWIADSLWPTSELLDLVRFWDVRICLHS